MDFSNNNYNYMVLDLSIATLSSSSLILFCSVSSILVCCFILSSIFPFFLILNLHLLCSSSLFSWCNTLHFKNLTSFSNHELLLCSNLLLSLIPSSPPVHRVRNYVNYLYYYKNTTEQYYIADLWYSLYRYLCIPKINNSIINYYIPVHNLHQSFSSPCSTATSHTHFPAHFFSSPVRTHTFPMQFSSSLLLPPYL